jgi:hypothetical protein
VAGCEQCKPDRKQSGKCYGVGNERRDSKQDHGNKNQKGRDVQGVFLSLAEHADKNHDEHDNHNDPKQGQGVSLES